MLARNSLTLHFSDRILTVEISATIPRVEQKRFDNLVGQMVRATDREAKTVVRNTARDTVKIAMKFTPFPEGTTKSGRRIRTKGFAKSGWVRSMLGLGIKPKTSVHKRGGRKGWEYGLFEDNLSRHQPAVTIGNRIPYIEDLDRGSNQNPAYHILARSQIAAINAMHWRLERMAKRMGKRWRLPQR